MVIRYETTVMAVEDLQKYHVALDKARAVLEAPHAHA